MEMMTDATSRSERSFGRTPRSFATLNNTRENSPPPESRMATLAAPAHDFPSAGPPKNRTEALMARKTAIPVSSVGRLCSTTPRSRLAPAVMKKIPRRMPSKGRTSALICALYRLPARRTPAAKAPVVADRPRASATCPIESATSSAAATKVSVDLAAATNSKTYLRMTDPSARTAPKPMVALAASRPSSPPVWGPDPAARGRRTRRGATARSCRRRMERAATPSGLSSQFLAFKTGRTNAELLRAPADAIQKACTGDENIWYT
mmetsp:Transcript_5273/g.7628  ORF Transcript_5273/g.7628 Transcript_5273/m.7628 type:complete len:264 (-) Transcript_5273:162-953(-)